MTDLSDSAAAASLPDMNMAVGKNIAIAGRWDASLTVQKLPRCWRCGTPHPLAQGDRGTTCIQCDADLDPLPEAVEVPGVLTGPAAPVLASRFLLWLGRACERLSRKL